MGFNCGILGLPNVGKSTLFNALTSTQVAESKNYPFCTIEPNIGKVMVKDERLDTISKISKSEKKIYNQLEFVDIAGLVKGASKGEGLGNKFLGNLNNVDAIIHIIRCFEDSNITHVNNKIDPIKDIEIIETELLLSDLSKISNVCENLQKKIKGNADERAKLDVLNIVKESLSEGIMLRDMKFTKEEKELVKELNFLTLKPLIYVCNLDEKSLESGNEFSKKVIEFANKKKIDYLNVSASIESQIAQIENYTERLEYLNTLNIKENSLDKLIKKGYKMLDLITFFTSGPKESRAWSIKQNSSAPKAAAKIHTDFQKGFIRAETISYTDFVEFKGELGAKEAGKVRQEGKDYLVEDGDIITFKFNV
tara:strand:+ start:363 stop:1460 length:1098 start_codon:yes stop_codon:yes gene_type:complete